MAARNVLYFRDQSSLTFQGLMRMFDTDPCRDEEMPGLSRSIYQHVGFTEIRVTRHLETLIGLTCGLPGLCAASEGTEKPR